MTCFLIYQIICTFRIAITSLSLVTHSQLVFYTLVPIINVIVTFCDRNPCKKATEFVSYLYAARRASAVYSQNDKMSIFDKITCGSRQYDVCWQCSSTIHTYDDDDYHHQ